MIGLGGFGAAVWIQSLPTVEGWAWDLLFFVGFAGLFLLSSTTLIRLFFLWGRVKGLLSAIAAQPMMRLQSVAHEGHRDLRAVSVHPASSPVASASAGTSTPTPGRRGRKRPTAPAALRELGLTADKAEMVLADALAAGRTSAAAPAGRNELFATSFRRSRRLSASLSPARQMARGRGCLRRRTGKRREEARLERGAGLGRWPSRSRRRRSSFTCPSSSSSLKPGLGRGRHVVPVATGRDVVSVPSGEVPWIGLIALSVALGWREFCTCSSK